MEQLQQILWEFSALDMVLTWIFWLVWFFWVWSIIWTALDISARSQSIFRQILSIIIVAIGSPIIWLPIYFLIRPRDLKEDIVSRKDALYLTLIQCNECGWVNRLEHEYCITCWKKLKVECKECKARYSYEWDYCSQCWAPNILISEKS